MRRNVYLGNKCFKEDLIELTRKKSFKGDCWPFSKLPS